MADDAGEDHEGSAAEGQDGDDEPSANALVLGLLHPHDEDGQVHGVDGDDGDFRRVEDELAHQGGVCQVGQEEVQTPSGADEQAQDGGVVGQIGGLVHLDEDVGTDAFPAGGHGVHTTAAAQHEAVHGAHAGDGDEQVEDVAQDVAEDVDKGHGRAVVDQLLVGGAAGDAHVIGDVDGDDDDAADDQGAGQVLLGILQLCVDGGGDDPAFIGEGSGTDSGQQGVAGGGVAYICHRRKVCSGHAVHQAVDNANDCHQCQRDELDDGGGSLDLACQLGGQGVDGVGTTEEEHGQSHTFRADDAAALGCRDNHGKVGVDGVDEDQGVAGAEPGQDRGHGGVVDSGHKPAHVVAVLGAHQSFGVVHHAVDLLILLCHVGKGQDAGDHDEAADGPGSDAQGHITVGLLQDRLRLEEHAGTDDDADDQAYGGK